MEYPHQQYVQYHQRPGTQSASYPHRRPGPPLPGPPVQAGSGDYERPMAAAPSPSQQEAALSSLQSLAQCSREEALFYLREHNFDVHQAMAARAADVRWDHQQQQQRLGAREQPLQPAAGVPVLESQLQEARARLRGRYEREAMRAQQPPADIMNSAVSVPVQSAGQSASVAPPPVVQAAPLPPPSAYVPPLPTTMPPLAQPYNQPYGLVPTPQPLAAAPPPTFYQPPQPQPVYQQQPTYAATGAVEDASIDVQADLPSAVDSHSAQAWEEARLQDASVDAGTAPRESYLTLAGQTLGRWIWGGTHHKDKHSHLNSVESSMPTTATTTTTTTSPTTPFPLSSSVSSPAFYPSSTTTVAVGEDEARPSMSRRHLSDEALDIHEISRRPYAAAVGTASTARDEEAHAEEHGQSRGGLRHLIHSVRNRIDHRHRHGHDNNDHNEQQRLPPAAEEEELEETRRRSHRRRSSLGSGDLGSKRERRASIDQGWVLVDSSESSLTDEQLAVRLSRQLAEEEERQRRRDEEYARRLQREEEAEVRRRAREAQTAQEEALRREARATTSSRTRRRSSTNGPVRVLVSRGPFGEMIISDVRGGHYAPDDETAGQIRFRRRGLAGLFEVMREMHEIRLAENATQESGYGSFIERLDPTASRASNTTRRQDMSYEQMLGLAERVGNVNRGVSKVAMAALPTRTFRDKDKKSDPEDNKCTICLCDYEEGDTLRTLPCLHAYHKDCIDNWLKSHNTCPVCKTAINM